jgi:hypothetical protein
MGKRFTCTEKWRKPFIKALNPYCKLLWLYILDDCDSAGIWQVDMEVASLRIGYQITLEEALECYNDKIVLIDGGEKWFIPSFIEFQYPSGLSENNRAHISIIKNLDKYKNQIKPLEHLSPAPYKPLEHLAKGAMDMDKDMVMDMDMVKDKDINNLIKAKIEIIYPFNSEQFNYQWSSWKAYKKIEHKFHYKTAQSEQASLMDLAKVSSGDESTAIKIIQQSMANGWKGFFELKNNENGNSKTHQTRISAHVTNEQLHESLAKRFG